MPRFVRGFIIPEVAEAHQLFAQLLLMAERFQQTTRGSPNAGFATARLNEYRAAYVDFNNGLRQAARQGATQATQEIRLALDSTRVRTDTGEIPHLRDLIRCVPMSIGTLETGMVGVGELAELNRAINTRSPGYGPYWQAQEYGTGSDEVPSQVGRVIFGYFAAAGGGEPTRPQAQYAGGGGPHPIFIPTANAMGSRGGRGGIGTIGVEILGRHFIRTGADVAAVAWRSEIAAVQQRAFDRLAALGP